MTIYHDYSNSFDLLIHINMGARGWGQFFFSELLDGIRNNLAQMVFGLPTSRIAEINLSCY